jgi:hypothetical protein
LNGAAGRRYGVHDMQILFDQADARQTVLSRFARLRG